MGTSSLLADIYLCMHVCVEVAELDLGTFVPPPHPWVASGAENRAVFETEMILALQYVSAAIEAVYC